MQESPLSSSNRSAATRTSVLAVARRSPLRGALQGAAKLVEFGNDLRAQERFLAHLASHGSVYHRWVGAGNNYGLVLNDGFRIRFR